MNDFQHYTFSSTATCSEFELQEQGGVKPTAQGRLKVDRRPQAPNLALALVQTIRTTTYQCNAAVRQSISRSVWTQDGWFIGMANTSQPDLHPCLPG